MFYQRRGHFVGGKFLQFLTKKKRAAAQVTHMPAEQGGETAFVWCVDQHVCTGQQLLLLLLLLLLVLLAGFSFSTICNTSQQVQCDRRHVSLRECRNHLCYLVSMWVESGKYDVSVPVKPKEIGMIAPMMDSPQYFGFPHECFISRFRVGFLGVKNSPPKSSHLEES